MATCNICGESIPDGSRTCSVCGSGMEDFLPGATGLHMDAPASQVPVDLPPGGRYCPVCAKVYGPEYTDAFCECGTELAEELPQAPAGDSAPMEDFGEDMSIAPSPDEEVPPAPLLDEFPEAPIADDVPMAPTLDAPPYGESVPDDVPMAPMLDAMPPAAPFLDDLSSPPLDDMPALAPLAPPEEADAGDVKVRLKKPASGTPCLVLYGPDKSPLQYFELTKDATTIGRLDAVAGVFPDVDLDEWFDRATIRKVSRQHAVILRTRASNTFALRPLAGNTGTQLEAQMVEAQQDYPLRPGHRIILGGVIRLKFEIA